MSLRKYATSHRLCLNMQLTAYKYMYMIMSAILFGGIFCAIMDFHMFPESNVRLEMNEHPNQDQESPRISLGFISPR